MKTARKQASFRKIKRTGQTGMQMNLCCHIGNAGNISLVEFSMPDILCFTVLPVTFAVAGDTYIKKPPT